MDKHPFALAVGDSIVWEQPEFVDDSTSTNLSANFHTGMIQISRGHSIPLDTIVGLKNWKPVVIIAGKDTSVHWWGDTIRFNTCKPDTVYKIAYRNIQHANVVNIGPRPVPDTLTPNYIKTHYKSSSGGGCSRNTYIMYLVGGDDLSVYLFFTSDISEVVKSFSPVATKMKYYPKDKCLYLQIYSDISSRQLQGFVTDVICSPPSPRPVPDSTIKPSYSYFLRHDNPQRYYQALDSVNIISGLIGKAMLYEDAVYWLNARARNLGILYNESRVDSVKVGGGK